MFKRFLTGAALALAAGLGMAAPASASMVTFNDVSSFSCDVGAPVTHQGMTFDMSWYRCYYSPADSADFPTPLTSTTMATGYVDTFFSTEDGGDFDLLSMQLAFGPFDHEGLTSDTTILTGYLSGGGTVTTTLTVGYGFQTYNLGWHGLTGVNVSPLQANGDDAQYLAFDNIHYFEPSNPNAGGGDGVPEPAVWAMLLLGFATSGLMLRRAQKLAHATIS